MALLSLADWRSEQLRLTAFPVLGVTGVPTTEWWQFAMGDAPDESTSNPKKGASSASGVFGDGKLVLKTEPERIDWLWLPASPDAELALTDLDFPSVGPTRQSLEVFSQLAERWFGRNDLPPVGRLAFGAVCRHREIDRRSGYVRLQDYLPTKIATDASDFLFQINHPVPSHTGVPGLIVNRLSKWSVAALRLVATRVVAATGEQQSLVTPEPVFALRAELDINTAPGFEGPLPPNRLFDIYRELVQFGEQIIREGITKP